MAIYLDYNATAPLCYEAYQAASEAFSLLGNPSSVHGFGRVVRQKIETARQHIADFLGVSSQRLVFTSGATESNNLALASFPGRVLISAIEHDSIQAVREDAILIPVLEDGTLDLEALEKLLSQPYQGPTLVSVMMANNETGVIQPLFDVITLARQYGAVVHSDAVQGLGRLEFPWHNLDMISFSSHKIGGPTGVGCLIVPAEGVIRPLLKGGGQERFYRAGTENIAGILGFAAACLACSKIDWKPVQKLRLEMEKEIQQFTTNSVIFGGQAKRLPNTTLVSMPGVKSETQVMNLDLLGFAVSSGSACSSGKVYPSRVLKAMGIPEIHRASALRISLPPTITEPEVERFVQAWHQVLKRCGKDDKTFAAGCFSKNVEKEYGYATLSFA